MLALGIDLETTGLAPDSKITEIGGILFDSDTWNVVDEFQTLVYEPNYPNQTKEIEEITHITQKMLVAEGVHPIEAFDRLWKFSKEAKFCLAHNKIFDKTILQNQVKEYGIFQFGILMLPWLCTKTEVPFKKKRTCSRLSHMALDMGIVVNPNELHRALPDIRLMGKILKLNGIPGKYLLDYAQSESFILEAVTQKPWTDGGASKDIAKLNGFQWDAVSSTWRKIVKRTELDAEIKKCSLQTVVREITNEKK